MSREPTTAAVRQLRREDVDYRSLVFDYRRFPGAEGAAEALGLDPHAVIKTIVMETDDGQGALVLMNGDSEVSAKSLARLMSVKSTRPASERKARKWTGYEFGGTSPFGTRKSLPVYAQAEIATMDEIYINGGSRGFLIAIDPADLIRVIGPQLAELST